MGSIFIQLIQRLHSGTLVSVICVTCVRSFSNSETASQWQWDAAFGKYVRVSPLSQPYNLW